jgi:hypothetical protein
VRRGRPLAPVPLHRLPRGTENSGEDAVVMLGLVDATLVLELWASAVVGWRRGRGPGRAAMESLAAGDAVVLGEGGLG